MPAAILNAPTPTDYERRVLQTYVTLKTMVPEGFGGRGPITLREIDLYIGYYPVEDVYYLIDLMASIEREHDRRNNKSSS